MIRRDPIVRRPEATFVAVIALILTAVACASVLFAVPRPAPLELPVLYLERASVDVQLAEDRALGAAPHSALTRELYRVLLEVGRWEFEQHVGSRNPPEVHAALRSRAEREIGAKGLKAVRAYATQRFMRALSDGLADADEERGVVGAMFDFLLEHGYVTRDGALLAPELSVRASYKVRWNMIFEMEPTAGLSSIEQRAYHGFRALEAQAVPDLTRHEAFVALLQQGRDPRIEQAAAIWQARVGQRRALVPYLEDPHATLRLRNMALGVVAQQQ